MPNLPNWKQTLVRLLSGYFFAAIAYYMIPALIVLNLTARNTEPVLIGLLAACQPVGLLLALALVEPLVARYGAYATFMGAFWLALGVSLSFILSDALLLWAVAVILVGVASGIYYVIAESWVALLCPPEQRGQIVSIFETIIGATSLLAPLILLLTGTSGWLPFVVTAILTGIGLLIFLPMHPPGWLAPHHRRACAGWATTSGPHAPPDRGHGACRRAARWAVRSRDSGGVAPVQCAGGVLACIGNVARGRDRRG
ncbi:MAG: MFS transporter [Chloroflexaceae bacterium]|nr:MFS transporter [Chloroflexaceae bacterium]